MPPTNPLVSKILQLVSSFQNTSEILKWQFIVVVLNGCKCSKLPMSIDPNGYADISSFGITKEENTFQEMIPNWNTTLTVSSPHNIYPNHYFTSPTT